ncbi:YafY family protein [Aeromicrobium sp. Leaf350]|uniref:helix-turn-helix transcriptional regulator n=1 Tax=Aeromicrobium sp. Leaf350 TaxID=2876565 RepID=UPI001E59E8E6|nr:WYL domain-containing protein [Aeromicrobium sp. Leaf350]
MNRTERLYAMREELRRADTAGRTADQLARTFEVSSRTVKRDISALQLGGFPVYAVTGRHGRYVVDRSATLPPVNFTHTEASALAAAITAHGGQPFDAQARAALTKVLEAMEPGSRARTRGLTDRIWIDLAADAAPTASRRVVEQALVQQLVVTVHVRRVDEVVERSVDPVILAHTRGRWFLVARCRDRDLIRWYGLDDVVEAHLTTQPASGVDVARIGTPPPTARPVGG